MRSLFGWLRDPYIHVMLIAAGMVWFSMLPQPKARSGHELFMCSQCHEVHDGGEGPCAIKESLARLVGKGRRDILE